MPSKQVRLKPEVGPPRFDTPPTTVMTTTDTLAVTGNVVAEMFDSEWPSTAPPTPARNPAIR